MTFTPASEVGGDAAGTIGPGDYDLAGAKLLLQFQLKAILE